MGSLVVSSVKILLLFVSVSSAVTLPAFSLEFDVGGEDGWVVPSKSPDMYNRWASKNRFNVGDTVRFKYKKDPVMVVMEEGYEKCKSTNPLFFSNNGDTEYKFEHSGTFYFISGIGGHCERGQKMIIKVISHSDAPGTSPPSPDSSNVVAFSVTASLQLIAPLIGSAVNLVNVL